MTDNAKRNPKRPGAGGGAKTSSRPSQPGLTAREFAVDLIVDVLHDGRTFDDSLAKRLQSRPYAGLEPRDRGLARSIAANALRYANPLNDILAGILDKPLPAKNGRVAAILLSGATQLLVLKTPPHAAISLSVDQTRKANRATHLDKMVNAVLRKVSTTGAEIFARMNTAKKSVPQWLFQKWSSEYGAQVAQSIAEASLREAPLDITLKPECDPVEWGGRLSAAVLETGSLRLAEAGRVEELAGFGDGAWWVQDAAAALPVRLLGDIQGKDVADVCAAPGGKTLQLAAAGARVVALDQSAARLERVRQNLSRTRLEAELVAADAIHWQPPDRQFDAILIDAPCSATGTIRRHPDILHLKQEGDLAALAVIQRGILENAARLLRPGGEMVYCTCSLQADEGERQIAAFLAEHPGFEIRRLEPGEAGIPADWITPEGHLRTLPCFTPIQKAAARTQTNPIQEPTAELEIDKSGMDGFFAARLRKAHAS
ncbi:MAG: methyltransferase domain-containing protein [Alphaproteobacteria bacterium]|nr:methyltransferase domain-containing protein [Alphaproteobacteria bacterium]